MIVVLDDGAHAGSDREHPTEPATISTATNRLRDVITANLAAPPSAEEASVTTITAYQTSHRSNRDG